MHAPIESCILENRSNQTTSDDFPAYESKINSVGTLGQGRNPDLGVGGGVRVQKPKPRVTVPDVSTRCQCEVLHQGLRRVCSQGQARGEESGIACNRECRSKAQGSKAGAQGRNVQGKNKAGARQEYSGQR